MAPESLRLGKYSVESDVWSYGVVLWEIFSRGLQPYKSYSNNEVVEKVQNGWKLGKPLKCPDIAFSIMQKCWEERPRDRPSFVKLVRLILPLISPEFEEKFREKSFYFSSVCCESERAEDKDEGFIASGSLDPSIEDPETLGVAEDSFPLSSAHYRDEDEEICLTPDETKRASRSSLSCLSNRVTTSTMRLAPSNGFLMKHVSLGSLRAAEC
ncbi:insulin-like growth factor 1 receptor [Oratosquilla oratoria]|uniref:insulin-like growth factor 1 receptor n=1 Tax=Oratosquilla oratoria TaxID=337810 RepID=UPI003F76E189